MYVDRARRDGAARPRGAVHGDAAAGPAHPRRRRRPAPAELRRSDRRHARTAPARPGHALVPSGAAQMIDIAQVQGQVHAQSVQRVGELAERNPNETVSIVRQWLNETRRDLTWPPYRKPRTPTTSPSVISTLASRQSSRAQERADGAARSAPPC